VSTLRERIQLRIRLLRERATDPTVWGGARVAYERAARELESDLLDSEPPTAADHNEVTIP
jgi:hypothetical protein